MSRSLIRTLLLPLFEILSIKVTKQNKLRRTVGHSHKVVLLYVIPNTSKIDHYFDTRVLQHVRVTDS